MLYIRILEKILNERDTKKTQYAQLIRVCESTIQEIRSSAIQEKFGPQQQVPLKDFEGVSGGDDGENNNVVLGESNKSLLLPDDKSSFQVDSEKYFLPLEMATKGDSPKVTILALDGIQKLLAHGHLTGNYPSAANPNKRLIDFIVETICSCFTGVETDEGVELQIIKALLTVVTSQHVQIHEGSVLLTLRTCFNIYLLTKNQINQTTSRAMLTQMLQSIFTRMEIAYDGISECPSQIDGDVTPEKLEEITGSVENWDQESVTWFNQMDLSSLFYNANQALLSTYTEEGLDNPTKHSMESLEGRTISISGENDNEEHIPLNQNEEPVNFDSSHQNIIQTDQKQKNSCSNCHSILQKDAFLVLWAVCKLAAKPNVSEDLDLDTRKQLEYKSTILSFQLIKSVLNNCGTVFQSSPMLCTAVKQYLCTTLRTTGVSINQEIFKLKLDLLIILIDKFQNNLSKEIEKLMEEVLFPVMEKPATFSNEYILLTLGTVNRIFNNFTSLVDLLAGEESGVFERMISYTCKLTNSENYSGDPGPLTALPIRMLALESITLLLSKMSLSLEKKTENFSPQVEEGGPVVQIEETDTSTFHNLENQFENTTHSFISALFTLLETIPDTIGLDIMIQKTAQRLFEKGNFGGNLESADAIYALMYSSICLIGELSSQQGRRRANKEWFVKLNQPGWCRTLLSSEFLESVFDEIDAHLKQQVKHRKQQNICVQSQSLNVMHSAKKIITNMGLHQSSFFYEKQVRSVKKMFKIMGKSVLNALLGTLIIYDDTAVTDICLDGLQKAIHISAVLSLKNERDAFVQALSRLNLAALKEIKNKTANALVVKSKTSSTTTTENGVTKTTITTTTETKCRNVDIILTLLNVAINEGNYLTTSWLDTLKCVSQLEASELMRRNSSRTPSPTTETDNDTSKSWYTWAGSLVPTLWDNSSKLDIASVKQSIDTSVTRIFLNSTKLDENGIVEFFKALCQVSLIEITHPENPRSFVYEKIFEVAHINMHRSSQQWCSIWQVLSDYFSHLACSSDEDVSFFAIDSITKLVVHLLAKEALGNFRFQDHFLRPYETVMQNTPFVSTREHVIGAIAKIVRTHASQLRSGWSPIFRILQSSVFHDSLDTAEMSFSMLKDVINMFTGAELSLQSSYHVLLRCLADLGFKGQTQNVQTESLKLMKKIASLVYSRPELFLTPESPSINPSALWTFGWLPIFNELSSVVIDAEKCDFTDANQATALTIIFELVKEYGESFHTEWWQSLFGLLFSIFNKLKFNGEDSVLFAIIDTFIRQYDILGDVLMGTLLNELEWCIRQQGHDQIALAGVQCLHQLIRMLHNKMHMSEWTLISNLIQSLLQTLYPLQNKVHNDRIWNPVVQLELLKVVKTILIPPSDEELQETVNGRNETTDGKRDHSNSIKDIRTLIGDRNLFCLLDAIETKISLIVTSHKEMKKPLLHVPFDLQLQETLLMDTYLRFLVQMYFHQSWSNDEIGKIENRFTTGVAKVLECFVTIQPITPNHLHDLTDIMTVCIQNLHHKVPQEKFLSFATILYPNFCDLLDLELEPEFSTALAKYFLAVIRLKIGDKYLINQL
ncbi:brefeldin A-inhibited guanine nucleotide-exchange protein 2 isoform X3 [Folsomia candida]|uniref:brefeldin A-inhibited guanine nucleotide-exchange protein 2 isoform X3 n=1 Tax=Folsomia candida TaxID=158441 RepID=UPI000B8FD3C3|nr:brefeldin A-inhibited guanine nucleotide-exchange protein 2 isoform X3 [Folsomia candida]